jgi:hypothetical protein
MMKITGLDRLQSSFDKLIKRSEKRVIDYRKQIAAELIDALLANTPVWSGKTVRSIEVSNSPSGNSGREPHPDRKDYSKTGRWENHKDDFGDTLNMPLGPEPNRKGAEAIAKASVNATDYGMDAKVFITSNSYMWDIIDDASYNGSLSRNTAVVSQIAIGQIKSKFGKVIK